jgi:hypothetical protein
MTIIIQTWHGFGDVTPTNVVTTNKAMLHTQVLTIALGTSRGRIWFRWWQRQQQKMHQQALVWWQAMVINRWIMAMTPTIFGHSLGHMTIFVI